MLHVWIPSTPCLLHREGDVVTESYVLTVVQSARGAGRALSDDDGGGDGMIRLR